MPAERERTVAWLRRLMAVTLERRQWGALIEEFQEPDALGEAPVQDLCDVGRLQRATAERLRQGATQQEIDAEWERMEARHVRLLVPSDPDYPAALRQTNAPPMALYCAGQALARDAIAVAIVGPRAASPHAREVARRIATAMARAGITVVSGFAAGVDGISHAAAVEAGGRTLAVLGCGLGINYPADHAPLRERIVQQQCGALFSEYPMSAQPLAYHFPPRNEIIAGLALATIVVEAAEKSGALGTARAALEENRLVFAVPGDLTRSGTRGSNALLREGAIALTAPEDVFEDLQPQLLALFAACELEPPACIRRAREIQPADGSLRPSPPGGATHSAAIPDDPFARRLVERIAHEPADLDTLMAEFVPQEVDIGRLSTLLLQLELLGILRQLPGRRYACEGR